MLKLSTVGNATLIAYDKEPILTTDPWILDIMLIWELDRNT